MGSCPHLPPPLNPPLIIVLFVEHIPQKRWREASERGGSLCEDNEQNNAATSNNYNTTVKASLVPRQLFSNQDHVITRHLLSLHIFPPKVSFFWVRNGFFCLRQQRRHYSNTGLEPAYFNSYLAQNKENYS